jgi:hydrogenase nickel incorporation protein HypB
LDAAMIDRALEREPPPEYGLVFIENVGNLVCPAGFDLGEHRKVVVVSVTEGEDKPLKYPDMFAVADLVLINKIDLLPHLDFDVSLLERNIARVKPEAKIVRVSARTGEGFEPWLRWLRQGIPGEKRVHA